MEYQDTVPEQAIKLYDKMEKNNNKPKTRGGGGRGAGRKSTFGKDVETAQYLFPKDWAKDSQEYAKVAMSNQHAPMQCSDGIAIQRMQLPKGHKKLIEDIERRWLEQGVPSTPHVTDGYPLPDHDNIIIEYTDVTNLVELVREYAFSAGVKHGMEI